MSDYNKIDLVTQVMIKNKLTVKIDSLEEIKFFKRLNDLDNYLRTIIKAEEECIKARNNFKKLRWDRRMALGKEIYNKTYYDDSFKRSIIDNKIYKLRKNLEKIVSETFYEMKGQSYKELQKKEKRRERAAMWAAFKKFMAKDKSEKDDNQK